jgi:formate dehydrogenase (NADP+) alpha subunit
MEQVSLRINGVTVVAQAGTSILKAASEHGIRIPTLCHHPHLEPAGACRLCIVEDEKSGRIMASCVTPVVSGMAIQTNTQDLQRHRANILRLIMANHPESCIVCNKGNRCELRRLAAELGIGAYGLYRMPHYTKLEEANPFIVRDLTKCIVCGKCIRADHELVAVGAIDYNHRGLRSRPATALEKPLEKSSCTFCGTCVSMCPTGALMTRNRHYAGTPQKEASTLCGFCGVGCSLVIGSTDGRVVDVNPSHSDHTVNRSTLCVRGHFAHDFLNASERLTSPLIRKENGLEKATWEEALEYVARKLLSLKAEEGPQSIAFLGSSKCTLEENYLFQKIARVIVSTNNVDNGGALSGRAAQRRLEERLGGTGRVKPLSDLEKAEVILVLGSNPTQSAPVLGYHLRRASRKNGIPVIVADPRRTEFVPSASLWLPLRPNSDSELIHGIAQVLMKQGRYDRDFVSRFTMGMEEYERSLSFLDLERACEVTGLDVKVMEKAAGLLAGKRITFVMGHGVFLQPYGLQVVDGAVNLALMTGSVGNETSGFYRIVRENNEAGAWDMGTVPHALPGRLPVAESAVRKHWERSWHTPLSPDPGLDLFGMITEAERGNLKALYVMGENPVRALPGSPRVGNALKRLKLLVVQDILETETTRLAHVVLPGAPFSEKAGAFTNIEGRIQSFEPAVPLLGEAKADWEILDLLAGKMGWKEPYGSIEHIRYEISSLAPGYADLARSRGTAWVQEKGEAKLFSAKGGGSLLSFTPYSPILLEGPDKDYPYQAILGSPRCHLGSGTRTSRSARIREYASEEEVDMSFQDGRALGIQEGDGVRISSAHGTIQRRAALSKGVGSGLIYVPRAVDGNSAASLIPLVLKGGADWAGMNVVAVKIEKGSPS